MSTFKARGFRKSINDKNKKMEIELRKSGYFQKSKPFRFSDVKSNQLFEEVIKEFYETFKSGVIIGKETPINSIVEHSNHYSLTKSASFEISIGASYLRITPNRAGGLHLSRLQVDENFRGKRLGSLMMTTFIKLVLDAVTNVYNNDRLVEIPIIDLEVLENVGCGVNAIQVDVNKVVSFYEKFGFEVVESSDNHKRMELDLNLAFEYEKEFELNYSSNKLKI